MRQRQEKTGMTNHGRKDKKEQEDGKRTNEARRKQKKQQTK